MIRGIIFKESVDDRFVKKHVPSNEVTVTIQPLRTDGPPQNERHLPQEGVFCFILGLFSGTRTLRDQAQILR